MYAHVLSFSKNLYCFITCYADLKILRSIMFGVIRKLTWFFYFLSYTKLASYTVISLAPLHRISLSRFFFLFLFFLPTMDSLCLFDPHRNIVHRLGLDMLFMDMVVVFLRRDSFHSIVGYMRLFYRVSEFRSFVYSNHIIYYYLDYINIMNNKRKKNLKLCYEN